MGYLRSKFAWNAPRMASKPKNAAAAETKPAAAPDCGGATLSLEDIVSMKNFRAAGEKSKRGALWKIFTRQSADSCVKTIPQELPYRNKIQSPEGKVTAWMNSPALKSEYVPNLESKGANSVVERVKHMASRPPVLPEPPEQEEWMREEVDTLWPILTEFGPNTMSASWQKIQEKYDPLVAKAQSLALEAGQKIPEKSDAAVKTVADSVEASKLHGALSSDSMIVVPDSFDHESAHTDNATAALDQRLGAPEVDTDLDLAQMAALLYQEGESDSAADCDLNWGEGEPGNSDSLHDSVNSDATPPWLGSEPSGSEGGRHIPDTDIKDEGMLDHPESGHHHNAAGADRAAAEPASANIHRQQVFTVPDDVEDSSDEVYKSIAERRRQIGPTLGI
jgi:hypothetical protein